MRGIEVIKPFVIGRDLAKIEALWQRIDSEAFSKPVRRNVEWRIASSLAKSSGTASVISIPMWLPLRVSSTSGLSRSSTFKGNEKTLVAA